MSPIIEFPKRVLIADDEEDICTSYGEVLESEGWAAEKCFDGASVEKKVEEFDPTVVILDLRMPKVDGLDVLTALKESHPWTRVIILTGHGNEDDAITCLNRGAFGYLKKVVSRGDLLEMCELARNDAPQPLLAFHQWYNAVPDPDQVVYQTVSGTEVTATRLMEEVRGQTEIGREFIRQVAQVAAELIIKRL